MSNRDNLIKAVRGGSPEGLFVYDLRKYGGRNLVVSVRPLSEEALRRKALETSTKWREHLLGLVLRGNLSLLEDEKICSPSDWESIRERVPDDVRERFDVRFRTEGVG